MSRTFMADDKLIINLVLKDNLLEIFKKVQTIYPYMANSQIIYYIMTEYDNYQQEKKQNINVINALVETFLSLPLSAAYKQKVLDKAKELLHEK